MKFTVDIIIRLLKWVSGDKKHHLDDLEKFSYISPDFSSNVSIPVENAKRLKKQLHITVDPGQVKSLIKMANERNMLHRDLADAYRYGHVKYDPSTGDSELLLKAQNTNWMYAVIVGYSMVSIAAAGYITYLSPIYTGLTTAADGIFAIIMLVLVGFVFFGTLVLWAKLIIRYVGARYTAKRVRVLLAAK